MTSLPSWIAQEAWEGYVAMRKLCKKPMTGRAEKLIIGRLYALKDAGHDPNAALDESTMNNWTAIYAPKGDPACGCDADAIPCPVDVIIGLYHETLPELPPVILADKRKPAIEAVWRWVLISKKPSGGRRATTADEAVAWFRGYFVRARGNDFLMGRDRVSTWRCDLDFLLTDKGMKQVIEKTGVTT